MTRVAARTTAPSVLPTVALVAVTAVWGSTFVLIKDVVDRLPVLDFLAVRFDVAAVAMVLVLGRHVRGLGGPQVRRALLLGAVYGVAQILQTYGLTTTPAAVSGFVTGTYVVLTPVIGAVLLRQRTSAATWCAVALTTVGLALLALRGLSVGVGELLTLASAALYAVHIVGLGAWSHARDALGLATVQMVAVAVLCTVCAAPGGLALPDSPGAWTAVLYTAVAAGALALVVQTWAQAHLSATRAAITMTMEPVFAACFAIAVGGEHLTWRSGAGGVLVLTGMLLAELAPRRAAVGLTSLVPGDAASGVRAP